MRRYGLMARIHDYGNWLTVGIDAAGRGGVYYPVAFAYLKWPVRWAWRCGDAYHSTSS